MDALAFSLLSLAERKWRGRGMFEATKVLVRMIWVNAFVSLVGKPKPTDSRLSDSARGMAARTDLEPNASWLLCNSFNQGK